MDSGSGFWCQIAASSVNGIESARFFHNHPTSQDIITMLKDVRAFGEAALVLGDGASINKSKATSAISTDFFGEPLAIIPPLSPHLSCPEKINR